VSAVGRNVASPGVMGAREKGIDRHFRARAVDRNMASL
jgi:hypothetical protein